MCFVHVLHDLFQIDLVQPRGIFSFHLVLNRSAQILIINIVRKQMQFDNRHSSQANAICRNMATSVSLRGFAQNDRQQK